MQYARSLLVLLLLVGSLLGTRLSIAAEDTAPPSGTSYEVKVLAQVAAALAAGIRAVRDLDGPPIENSNLDQLKIPTPGMDCGIDRALAFIVCRSVSLNREDAESMFDRMMNYGEAALSSGSWKQTEEVPRAGLTRSISYQHLKSGAHIDLDLVVYPTGEVEPRYGVRFFGWPRF
ncbi:MAG TPA: hypothetical protein VIB79_05035 [Candidatus Binatia bacterium]|jgi:hypothetical protein